MNKVTFTNLRFLVVDDCPQMRKIVRTILRGFGARDVFEAADGRSGFKAVATCEPDVVITDYWMPGGDGIELINRIRNPFICKRPYLPVIMLTAYADKPHIYAARDAGVTEFLCKPVSAKALFMRIYNAVDSPRIFVKTKNYFGPCRRRFKMPDYEGAERRDNIAGPGKIR